MPNIGTLAVLMTGGIAGFEASMKRSVQVTESSVSGIEHAFHGLEGALAALGIEEVGAKFVELVHGQAEAIVATGRLANQLGVTTESLVGLQQAAKKSGISSEDLSLGLEHMLRNLSQVAAEGGKGGDVLATLGLSARQLVNESPDKAFAEIATAIARIENPAQRAQAAVAVFGKSGQQLLPLLLQGKEGIAAATEEAEKLGLSFSAVDAAKVQQATIALEEIQDVALGIGRTIAIDLSPYITALAQKFTEAATSGGGFGQIVGSAIEYVVLGIAKAADVIEVFEAGWQALRGVAGLAALGLVGVIDAVGAGLVKLLNLLPGVSVEWTDTFSNLAEGLKQTIGEAFESAGEHIDNAIAGKNSQAVLKFFDDAKAKAEAAAKASAALSAGGGAFAGLTEGADKIGKIVEELQTQLDEFGKTEGQKKLDLAKSLGADDATLAQIQATVDAIDELKRHADAAKTLGELQKQVEQLGMTEGQKKLDDLRREGADDEQLGEAEAYVKVLEDWEAAQKRINDLQKDAESTIKSLETPQEKYNARVAQLNDELAAGLLTQQQFEAAVAKAQAEESGPTKLPNLIEAGSQQALKLVADIAGRSPAAGQTFQKETLDTAKLQLTALNKIAASVGGAVTVLSL